MPTKKYKNILSELEQLYTELKSYKSLQERLLSQNTLGHWYRERDELREKLVRTTGMLKQIIITLTGKQYFVQNDTQYDMWNEAFNQVISTQKPSVASIPAITFCVDTTNEAIGRLGLDIQKGIRDEQTGELIAKSGISGSKPPEALTAKATWKAIESEFGITKVGFGRKINFVSDSFQRKIIFRDVEHSFALASLGYSKPAVILVGGIIEELLRLYLKFKDFKPIKDDFDGYIQTCETNRLLKTGISRLSDSVRYFRNLVHLEKEKTNRHTISKSTAKGAVASIFTIANDF